MLDTSKTAPSVDAWLRQAKADPAAVECGMYLTHKYSFSVQGTA